MRRMECEVAYVYAVIPVSLDQLEHPEYANFMEMVCFQPSPLPPFCYISSVLF